MSESTLAKVLRPLRMVSETGHSQARSRCAWPVRASSPTGGYSAFSSFRLEATIALASRTALHVSRRGRQAPRTAVGRLGVGLQVAGKRDLGPRRPHGEQVCECGVDHVKEVRYHFVIPELLADLDDEPEVPLHGAHL